MSLFSNLSEKVGALLAGAGGQDSTQTLSGLLSEGGGGGLAGIVSKLQQGGLGEQVSSWLGNGSNAPVTAEQLRAVLGEPYVQQLATKFGVPLDGVLNLLSQHLPAAVDKASPDGTLQTEDSVSDTNTAQAGGTPAPT